MNECTGLFLVLAIFIVIGLVIVFIQFDHYMCNGHITKWLKLTASKWAEKTFVIKEDGEK